VDFSEFWDFWLSPRAGMLCSAAPACRQADAQRALGLGFSPLNHVHDISETTLLFESQSRILQLLIQICFSIL
jgi:hypothetical protein